MKYIKYHKKEIIFFFIHLFSFLFCVLGSAPDMTLVPIAGNFWPATSLTLTMTVYPCTYLSGRNPPWRRRRWYLRQVHRGLQPQQHLQRRWYLHQVPGQQRQQRLRRLRYLHQINYAAGTLEIATSMEATTIPLSGTPMRASPWWSAASMIPSSGPTGG